MDLWFIYIFVCQARDMFGTVKPTDASNYADAVSISAITSVGITLALFVFQAIAVYRMAQKRRLRYKGLAFVPFANIILLGRIAGETTFFGQKIKRAGLYAMIAQIVVTAVACSYLASDVYLHQSGCIGYQEVEDVFETYRPYFNQGTSFEKTLFHYYDNVVYLLNMIFGLLCEILMLVLLSAVFKQYAPEKHMWLTVITLIVPPARCIILFVFRNRNPINYREYMRAKYEAFMRRQQQYYGQGGYNPYGPYGGRPNYGPQNSPNAQDTQTQSQAQPQEEPFSEFSSGKKSDDPFSEFSSDKTKNDDADSDGFFN